MVAAVLAIAGCSGDTQSPTPTAPKVQTSDRDDDGPKVVGTAASDLEVPWGVTFLPDGSALVSERDTSRVLAIEDGDVREVGEIAAAAPRGEAGLLGLAASPDFDDDHTVFAYVSTASDNRVVKFTYDGNRIGKPTNVLTGIPNGNIHDGGRLLFGDDGNLFVSTGDTGQPDLAQDRDSLAGKILRITPDGDDSVWSWGHRNVQGIAFDDDGRLWATEFGQNTWDELNLIEQGANYGWPEVEGKGDAKGMRNPLVQWRTDEASPSGLAFADGYLWAASLRGERLWRVPVTGDGVGEPQHFFVGDYGRMRTITVSPDGNLWVTTSNRDGRGDPADQDDRILIVEP
jgi:glucose/arabinose dehydrogenase